MLLLAESFLDTSCRSRIIMRSRIFRTSGNFVFVYLSVNFMSLFSDTGSYPPESCVFGQLLNMGAVISKYFYGFALFLGYSLIFV